MDKTEMRLDPLTQAWTIFSATRPVPPAFGSVLREPEKESPFVGGPRALRAAGALHTAPGAGAGRCAWCRIAPRSLRVEGDAARHSDGFYDRMDGVGAHEVIIEDPGDKRLRGTAAGARSSRSSPRGKSRMLDLMQDPRMRSFTVVKNVGAPAGERVQHSVSQLARHGRDHARCSCASWKPRAPFTSAESARSSRTS